MSAHHIRWRRPLAAAAILTATGAAVLAAVAPANAETTTLPITAGTLDWGVKASFSKYVEGPIGLGEILTTDGATRNADGTFAFGGGTGTYDTTTHNITTAFLGTVTFHAHKSGDAWSLDMSIKDVRVATNNADKNGTLTADVSSKDMSTGAVTMYDDVVLADLDLTGIAPEQGADGYTTLANIPAALTEAGAPAFGGFYQAGSALDPLTLKVEVEAPEPVESSSSTPTDPDPSSSNSSPSTPSSSATTAPTKATILDGTLDWGIKESFRDYITGPIANGKVDASGGATVNDSGYRYVKATGEYDATKNTLNASFEGAVRFYGHETDGHYELDLTFTDLSIKISGDKGVLYTGTTPLADLTVPAGVSVKDKVINLGALPAALTSEGSDFFGGFYQTGDALDPVTVALALDANATLPGVPADTQPGAGAGGPSVSLPVTGMSLTGIGIAGGVLVLAGTGALWLAARRRRVTA